MPYLAVADKGASVDSVINMTMASGSLCTVHAPQLPSRESGQFGAFVLLTYSTLTTWNFISCIVSPFDEHGYCTSTGASTALVICVSH